MRNTVDHDADAADIVDGIPTAKNQNGISADGKPIKSAKTSDNKTWQFGDSLAGITPNKIA